MKSFLIEFITVLANSVLVICFTLVSFLLLSNFFHYREVTNTYEFSASEDIRYKEYKDIMKRVNKKMNSVDYKKVEYNLTAKPIYEYYSGCVSEINKGTFAGFENKSSISSLDIYEANTEIINNYNNVCLFYIPYNVANIVSKYDTKVPFAPVKNSASIKNNLILDNANSLIDSAYGNSSYGFVTEITRSSIYNKQKNELKMTINNYKTMALLLDDIANWYVAEFGGDINA